MQYSHCNFYQDIVDLPQEVARHWSIIVQNAANGNPTLFSILNQASHSVDGNKIMIDFKGDHIEDILRSHNIEETISQAVQAMVHCPCHVICRIDSQQPAINNTLADFDPESYLRQLQQQAKTQNHTVNKNNTPPPPANNADNPAPKFRRKSERKLMIDNIPEEHIEITSIDGEMKNIVLRGRIFNINNREFNTGTNLLTFDLADESDGISCKVFLKIKMTLKK